jgi:kynurenine formamidase
MITYNGLPGPKISDFLSREQSRSHYAAGTEFQIGNIEMVANTGTYIDSPFHRYPSGADLAELELSSLANIEGIVVRCVDDQLRNITGKKIELLSRSRSLKNMAVLFHTGWDRHWRSERYWQGDHPFVTADAAELLSRLEVRLVGIDSYNIDDIKDGGRPAHSILLERGIPIVEHLCGLAELPDLGFRFFAVPPKVKAFGSFPIRAFAIVS